MSQMRAVLRDQRGFTLTVSYTPLSATGTNAISGTRSVSVTMQIAQR